MSLCAVCGFRLNDDSADLCPHHGIRHDDWASSNRIMCDFVHRGKVPPRLPIEAERDSWEPV